MQWRELTVPGAWEVTPQQLGDPRGLFMEMFRQSEFEAHTGHGFDLRQSNCSTSSPGVIRGIHFADVPPSQAKYVMCPKGAVLDVVVDIRVGSPTFGRWDSVLLDDRDRRAVYLSEGLGHGFCALDDSTVVYLCTAEYDPSREHGVSPLSPEIGIEWPTTDRAGRPIHPLFSEKDTKAPSLAQAREAGLLPSYPETLAFTRWLH